MLRSVKGSSQQMVWVDESTALLYTFASVFPAHSLSEKTKHGREGGERAGQSHVSSPTAASAMKRVAWLPAPRSLFMYGSRAQNTPRPPHT